MSTFGKLIDTFERLMAAVAFAESNDPETACWFLKSDSLQTRQRVSEINRNRTACRPELRM